MKNILKNTALMMIISLNILSLVSILYIEIYQSSLIMKFSFLSILEKISYEIIILTIFCLTVILLFLHEKTLKFLSNKRASINHILKILKNIFKYDLGWRIISLNIISITFISYMEICNMKFLFSNMFNNISYGIIVSTIFYLTAVLLPQEKKRNHISRFISHKISSINHQLKIFLSHINSHTNSSKEINIDEISLSPEIVKKMEGICKKINVGSIQYINPHPLTGTQGNWFEYLKNTSINIRKDVHDILQYSDILSYELVGLISEIDVVTNSLPYELAMGNKNLEIFAYPILEIISLSREANKFYQENYKHYSNSHNERYRRRLQI